MPNKLKKLKSIKKTITLYEDQVYFINDNSINLSRFVQKRINALMNGEEKLTEKGTWKLKR